MPKINFPTPTQTGLLNAAALAPEGVAEDGCQICGYCESKYPCHPRPPLVTPDCETRNIESVEVGGRSLQLMLRNNRAKDSNTALRNLCTGVNDFPCCCSCCHCSLCNTRVERYKKILAEQLAQQPKPSPKRKGSLARALSHVPAADGGAGDQFDGGHDGNDDYGGFQGTIASVDNCLYVMTGSVVHDEDTRKRIKCLQEKTRYAVPGISVSDGEGRCYELKSAWPQPQDHLSMSISPDTINIVILREIHFAGDTEKTTVGVCDCHCAPGIRGCDLKDALERGFNYNDGETAIDEEKFQAGLSGILHVHSVIPVDNTKKKVSCIHVELVLAALQ